MDAPQSLAVVVPTYRSGSALWIGISQALRWRDPRVRLAQIVIVDDGSPACGFRQGSARVSGVDLRFIVNPENRGQSESTWQGLGHVEADWAVLLEDDLLGWPRVLDAMVAHFDPGVELVSLVRPGLTAGADVRTRAQPWVRRIFRAAGAGDLVDPTSPIKALRVQTHQSADLDRWRRALHEGLVVLSRGTTEVLDCPLSWEQRPSRYTTGRLLRVGWNLWPRLALLGLRRLATGKTAP